VRQALALLLPLAGCVGAPEPAPVPAPVPATPAPVPPPAAPAFWWTDVPQQGGVLRGEAPRGAVTVSLRSGGQEQPAALSGTRFLVAFDRDAPADATLVARMADGRLITQAFTVAPRAWRLEQVSAPFRAGKSDAEFDRLRPAELARIRAARATVTDAAGWRERFRWPVAGRLSGLFGAQRVYRGGEKGSYHSGADVAAATGTPVAAPASGVVVLAADPAAPFTLEGNLLLIDHGGGLGSAFLHLSAIDVAAGQHVRQGQPVGRVGATGRATGPHLHWSLTWNGSRLDPQAAAGPMPAQ
jgi:murein DD-endopeptidase MepM/ murein hydrolase activator NlpD